MAAKTLVVDDDESIRRLLRHRLESAGYDVTVCTDGRDAADLLADGYCPDLAILDVMMPRLGGKELLRMIRTGELPVDPSLPVIFLTSRGREEHVVDGLERGADDYVTKPFSGPELEARVRRYLHG